MDSDRKRGNDNEIERAACRIQYGRLCGACVTVSFLSIYIEKEKEMATGLKRITSLYIRVGQNGPHTIKMTRLF